MSGYATSPHGSPGIIELAIQNWWLIWIAVMVGGSLLEGVRDFFIDAYRSIAETRHRHRIAEIKAQKKANRQLAGIEREPALAPGPCRHLHVTQVVDRDDNLVAWLCKNEDCREQLPADWATRKEDLE